MSFGDIIIEIKYKVIDWANLEKNQSNISDDLKNRDKSSGITKDPVSWGNAKVMKVKWDDPVISHQIIQEWSF